MEHILENTSLEEALNLFLLLCMDSDAQANAVEDYRSPGDKEVPFAAMQKTLGATWQTDS